VAATGTIKVYLEVPKEKEKIAERMGAKLHTALRLYYIETIREATPRDEPALEFATKWSRDFSTSMSGYYKQLCVDQVPQRDRNQMYNLRGRQILRDRIAPL